MTAALLSAACRDALSSMAAAPSGRAPCIHARLRRLATKSVRKAGHPIAVSGLSGLCGSCGETVFAVGEPGVLFALMVALRSGPQSDKGLVVFDLRHIII
jgi:hypothetical protein